MNLNTVFRLAAASLLLSGCGKLVDMSGGEVEGVERRVYLNDAAPAESLKSVIIGAGVYFVMQPGKSYQLKVRSLASGEQLLVLRARGDYYYGWKTLSAPASNDSVQTFTLQPEAGDSTRYYRAILQAGGGGIATKPLDVRFVPTTPRAADTLAVRVVLYRRLTTLPDSVKPAFAQALIDGLASVYAAYNIVIKGSFDIVEPTGSRFVAEFGGFNGFPARVPNTAHLYVVDNVLYKGVETPSVLGFAPREGFDLASDFVVLNARGIGADTSAAGKAAPLAVTAAHELGHLFGLRHTTSSGADRDADFDKSNTHDGFAPISQRCIGLAKRSPGTADVDIRAPDGRHYCLRTAATAECNCPDVGNLMFAYQCGPNQKAMAAGQINLLRWNASTFQ